jgi:hypothetical protein
MRQRLFRQVHHSFARALARTFSPVFKQDRDQPHQFALPGVVPGCEVGGYIQFDTLARSAIAQIVSISPLVQDAQALCLAVEKEIPTVRIVADAVPVQQTPQ